MAELHTVKAKPKLSHLTGPGRIPLGKGMLGDLREDQLQQVRAAQGWGMSLAGLEPQGVIKSNSKAVGVAKLPT
jgi:hypothetical protein